MLLTVATLVIGARSVDFLLMRVGIPKVIRVIGSPLLIGPLLLLAATVRSTTGLLPLLEPRMGMKPATTERTRSRKKQREQGKRKSKRERPYWSRSDGQEKKIQKTKNIAQMLAG